MKLLQRMLVLVLCVGSTNLIVDVEPAQAQTQTIDIKMRLCDGRIRPFWPNAQFYLRPVVGGRRLNFVWPGVRIPMNLIAQSYNLVLRRPGSTYLQAVPRNRRAPITCMGTPVQVTGEPGVQSIVFLCSDGVRPETCPAGQQMNQTLRQGLQQSRSNASGIFQQILQTLGQLQGGWSSLLP